MNILLVGASGFIGSELGRNLQNDGHTIRALGRDLALGRRILPGAEWRWCDLRSVTHPGAWDQYLLGIDVVINASGALQSGLRDNVGQVQDKAMRTLFAAAGLLGVRHIVQISAAGAGPQARGSFMTSKAAADAVLSSINLPHTIIRPGLVIGRDCFGGTELLRSAASIPFCAVVVPDVGTIQCVALKDVVEAVRNVLSRPDASRGTVDLVEPTKHTLSDVIAAHRRWLGFATPTVTLCLPNAVLRPLSLLADGLGWLGWRSPLRSNALAALVGGIEGDPATGTALLGRAPSSLPQILFDLGRAGKADRWHARLALVFPIALAMLFLLWLFSGLLGLARTDLAVSYLAGTGLSDRWARLLVQAGSVLDLIIALGLILRPTVKPALLTSLITAAIYCVGALMFQPSLWTDPLGPMLKVLPVLALTLACLAMAEER